MVCFSLPSRTFIAVEVGAECPYSDLDPHRPSDTDAAGPFHRSTVGEPNRRHGDSGDPNRHRPGDTWMIGGKPHDPDDPGVWPWKPDPTYRRDRRTGRHRRGELPDPLPTTMEAALASAATRTVGAPLPLTRKPRPAPPRNLEVHGSGEAPLPVIEPESATHRREPTDVAWARFLHFSEPLMRAHTAPPRHNRVLKALKATARWTAIVLFTHPNSWAR